MASSTETLDLFATRVRQLMSRFAEVKRQNDELCATLEKRDQEIEALKTELGQADRNYNNLKMAKMLEVSDGDIEQAKKRVAGLIREVNSCITVLSEK